MPSWLAQIQRMSRGNLRAAPATARFFKLARKRQLGLRGVPAPSELLGNGAPPIHFHAEAIEAERVRPFHRRIVIFAIPEAIARLPRPARCAQPRLAFSAARRRVAPRLGGHPSIRPVLRRGPFGSAVV